jgi:integrase
MRPKTAFVMNSADGEVVWRAELTVAAAERGFRGCIKPAAVKAGLGTNIGRHTFRPTYRWWLDSTGAPIAMQRELMRHASIETTMNVYGRAMMSDAKRQANSNVVRMALRPGFVHKSRKRSL